MHRLALARALAAAGVDLHVAIPFEPGDPRLNSAEFQLHRVRLDRGSSNPLREAATIRSMRELSRRLKPTLAHHVTIKPVLYGSLVARSIGTPAVVNSITGLGYLLTSSQVQARLLRAATLPAMRFGCNRSNVTMLFENGDDRDLYCQLGITDQRRSAIVPSSGVVPEMYQVREHGQGPVTVVLLGRMLWDKGVGEFVEAARLVKAEFPQTRFILIGTTDPNPESIPKERLKSWHDDGVIEYWGWRSDVPLLLGSMDILCLPSYREGLPRALLEGGAAGLALVTTDVPGCRDAVRANVSGSIVPPRDSKALANAILHLVANHDGRRAMGAAARADVLARFSVDSVIEQTCRIYGEALTRSL